MSKRKKKKEKRSVAGATKNRRERAEKDYSDMFKLPDGIKMFSIDGKGVIDIDVIPYTVGEGNPAADKDDFYWERTFFIHRNIGVNEDWVICPARTSQKPCPICEYISQLNNDPNADEDTIKALQPSKRMLLNVLHKKKKDKTWPDAVEVWHVSHAYFGKAIDDALAAAYEDEDDNMDNFCDPDGGSYLRCVAEPGWQKRGFSIERVDFKTRKEDLDSEFLLQAACLDDVLVLKDYDDLKELLHGSSDDEEKSDGKKKKKKKKSKKSDKKEEAEQAEEIDLDDLDEDELLEYMKENDIKIKGHKKMDEDELREAIQEQVDEGSDNSSDDSWADDKDGGNIDDLDEDELLEYMKENKIKIKGHKKMDEDELREAIQEQIDEAKSEEIDLDDLDEDELLEYMKENDIKIKGHKKMDEDELREAIQEQVNED